MRRFNFWALLLWIGPGAAASYLLRNSVPWVTLMSWYAIVVSHLAAWLAARAERAAKEDSQDG